jgi:hypothetical protein
MPVAAAHMAEGRTDHELGVASPAGVGERRRRLGRRGAPKLVLGIVDQVRHDEILEVLQGNPVTKAGSPQLQCFHSLDLQVHPGIGEHTEKELRAPCKDS